MEAEELFRELGADFVSEGNEHCRPGWIQLDCPFCDQGSKRYHLGFHIATRHFNCWRCGGVRAQAVLEAFGATGDQYRQFYKDIDLLPAQTSRPAGRLIEPRGRGPLLKAHRRYLESRGFDPDVLVRNWEIEGIGIAKELPWRIYIPVIHQGKRVSWTTRTIGHSSRRYVSASAAQEFVPHKECIYGADLACHSIVVVEGPTDVWRIGPGAGCLFGTAFTTAQVRVLGRYPYRYILLDNEATAQEQAQKLAEQLSCFAGYTQILQCDAKDPGSMSNKELKQLRRIAKLI